MSPASASAARHSLDRREFPGAFPTSDYSIQSDPATNISSHHSLSQAIHARRAEYVRPRTTRVKIGSWNVAARAGVEKDLAGWFVESKGVAEALAGLDVTHGQDGHYQRESVAHQEAGASPAASTVPRNDTAMLPGGDDIGIYALGLQEVVDVASPAEALRPYSDTGTAQKWKQALSQALPPGYQLVAEQQLVGLLVLIFASPEMALTIGSVSTTSVGTGLMGYMGNKGAVSARLVLGETTRLVFINSHLAAGADKTSLERRNWDAAQVSARTRFTPVTIDGVEEDRGDAIGDEDVAWWFGDLNYRLEGIPGDDVRRLLMLHTRNEYDIGHPAEQKIEDELARGSGNEEVSLEPEGSRASTFSDATLDDQQPVSVSTLSLEDKTSPRDDPTSLQATLASLLPHDQLHQQQAAGKALADGWQEAPHWLPPDIQVRRRQRGHVRFE